MTGLDICYQNPRLPIGAMELVYQGNIKDFNMRLDLYHAQLLGHLKTDLGEIDFQLLVHTREMLIMFFYQTTGNATLEEWEFIPAAAFSPRQQFGIETKQDFRIRKGYTGYDAPQIKKNKDQGFSCQSLYDSYENIVGWRVLEREAGYCLLVSIEQGKNGTVQRMKEYLNSFKEPEAIIPEHFAWWETYYQKSYISIPDKKLLGFYWIQIYKLACATRDRQNTPVIDNQGPWSCDSTPWPATWWNLNVQLSYMSCYTSNHVEMSHSLSNNLMKYFDNLIENVPEEYRYDSAGIGTVSDQELRSPVRKPGTDAGVGFRELGNLTWVMHNCWLYYQVTMDHLYLQKLVYPLLKRCINYYLHFLNKGEDGYYHLPETSSPEYGKDCKDCNYDLALLRFGCKTLLQCVNILGISDEKEKIWEDVLDNLTPYPTNENGFMIGADLPYEYSHRHFSHLLMIYPLYDITLDDKEMIPLLRRSVEHWWSMPELLTGFSCTYGSLLWSALGDGDKALFYLRKLWEGKLLPNTLYMEAGPVIETPLSGIQSILEMMLQSHGGVIRLFPAMPSEWKNACFEKLLAQGGFEVSAEYRDGELSFVELKNNYGNPCILEAKSWEWAELSDTHITILSKTRISIELSIGEKIAIYKKKNEHVFNNLRE